MKFPLRSESKNHQEVDPQLMDAISNDDADATSFSNKNNDVLTSEISDFSVRPDEMDAFRKLIELGSREIDNGLVLTEEEFLAEIDAD